MLLTSGHSQVNLDYFAENFHHLASLFSLQLYGMGEFTHGTSDTPQRVFNVFSRHIKKSSFCIPQQEHGVSILKTPTKVSSSSGRVAMSSLPGDGIVLCDPLWQGVLRFADCCPVVMFSAQPAPWMVMLHMGFRGALKGILNSCHSFFQSLPGFRKEATYVFVGPGIRSCCYDRRVEDPLTQQGMELFSRNTWFTQNSHVYFDLPLWGTLFWERAGIPPENIHLVKDCVCCASSQWYSYRRGDKENRNVLLGGLL